MPSQKALETVTRMACPEGSRIEVTASPEGYVVRVAYKMSAVSQHEKGGVTKHQSKDSMRREVETLSAHLIRDVFDACSTRGIKRLQVSCNHAMYSRRMPPDPTPEEREAMMKEAGLIMGVIHRASVEAPQAATVSNWRKISIPEVLRIMKMERDKIPNLDFGRWVPLKEAQEDPDMPLEF